MGVPVGGSACPQEACLPTPFSMSSLKYPDAEGSSLNLLYYYYLDHLQAVASSLLDVFMAAQAQPSLLDTTSCLPTSCQLICPYRPAPPLPLYTYFMDHLLSQDKLPLLDCLVFFRLNMPLHPSAMPAGTR